MTNDTPRAEREFSYLSDVTRLDFLEYIEEMAKELEVLCKAQEFDKLSSVFKFARDEAMDFKKQFL